MKLSKRQDIEAPLSVVFAAVSDFAGFERLALRRGIEISRTDQAATPGVGSGWLVRAPLRGRVREISVTITGLTPDIAITARAVSSGMTADITIDLVELSRSLTRLQFGMDMHADTLAAKLLLQSLKLAKTTLERRLAARIEKFAEDIESRQKKRLGRIA